MNATTGTPEDTERMAQALKAWGPAYDIERARYEDGNRSWISEGRQFKDGFVAGFLAARPSVTVDEITGLLEGHALLFLDEWADKCRCDQFTVSADIEDNDDFIRAHRLHQASVIVAHITGEGA